jgi:hypothetical protein
MAVGPCYARQVAAPQRLTIVAQARSPQLARDDDGPFRLQVCFNARDAPD